METHSKTTVELLSEDDLFWFVEVAAVNMMMDEVKRPELINLQQFYTLGYKMLVEGTAFVAKKDGECVGALGALLAPNPYNPDIKILAEMFWYVLPEHRETRAGAMLLKAYEEKGEEVADEATLSLLGSSQVNMKSLERRGWKLGEYALSRTHRRE